MLSWRLLRLWLLSLRCLFGLLLLLLRGCGLRLRRGGNDRSASRNHNVTSGPLTRESSEQHEFAALAYWCVQLPAPASSPRTRIRIEPGLPTQSTPP